MGFTWPAALLFVLAAPLVLGIYFWAQRRRRPAVTFSSLALVRRALPRGPQWRRHIALALLLASLVVLAIGSARPEWTSSVPIGKTTIILALDESGSMCLSDVLPNRLTVAQDAAREFVDAQPEGVEMGLVVFAGYAELVVPPTTDRSALNRGLDNLSTAPGTAIGAAILKSLDAIAEVDNEVPQIGDVVAPKPPRDGYVPDIIVLLTDGANNRGIAPLQAVPYAVARRVRIYTIGFGTTNPAPFSCTPQQQGGFTPSGGFGPGGGFGGGGYGGGGFGSGASGSFGGSPLVADLPPSARFPGSPVA